MENIVTVLWIHGVDTAVKSERAKGSAW